MCANPLHGTVQILSQIVVLFTRVRTSDQVKSCSAGPRVNERRIGSSFWLLSGPTRVNRV